jgi:hypothetical protein
MEVVTEQGFAFGSINRRDPTSQWGLHLARARMRWQRRELLLHACSKTGRYSPLSRPRNRQALIEATQ